MNLQVATGVSVHNKFEFQLLNANNEIKQQGIAYNTVTNNYYNRWPVHDHLWFSNLQVGTGTGTPSITDTSLFTYLTNKGTGFTRNTITYESVNNFSNSSQVVFTENEAVGDITEVGIEGNGLLYSHAMVTDAEGHVIAIHKTDTDRLIITITVYLTLDLPSTMLPLYGVSTFVFSYYGSQNRTTDWGNDYIWGLVRRGLGVTSNYWSAISSTITCTNSPGGSGGVGMYVTYDVDGNRVRVQNTERVLSEDGNLPGTYQIYGFAGVFGYIPITASIFTPLDLTLTEVADGTKTGFNFKIPELMTDSVKVYINDVLQSSSTYTWNGTDYVNSFQAWETTRADNIISGPCCFTDNSSSWNTQSSVLFNSAFGTHWGMTWSTDTMVYDFGTAKTFTRAYKPDAGTTYTDWEYSNDNQQWTAITIPATSSQYYDFPSPITARYLRTNTCLNGGWVDGWTPTHSQMCCFKNQLEFNTAPSANSVIKIEAKSAYPIKNSNWILDQFVLDFTISRGT